MFRTLSAKIYYQKETKFRYSANYNKNKILEAFIGYITLQTDKISFDNSLFFTALFFKKDKSFK